MITPLTKVASTPSWRGADAPRNMAVRHPVDPGLVGMHRAQVTPATYQAARQAAPYHNQWFEPHTFGPRRGVGDTARRAADRQLINNLKPSVPQPFRTVVDPKEGPDRFWTPEQFARPYYGSHVALARENQKAKDYQATLPAESQLGLSHQLLNAPIPVREAPRTERYSAFTRTLPGSGAPLGHLLPKALKPKVDPPRIQLVTRPGEVSESPAGWYRSGARPQDQWAGPTREPAEVLHHEMRHHQWEPVKGWKQTGALQDTPFTRDTTPHGLRPAEQLGWLSGAQRELFRQTGKRMETPDEAGKWLQRMTTLPEREFESEVKGWSSDAARGLRHLRQLDPDTRPRQQLIEQLRQWMPALVSNTQPAGVVKTAAIMFSPLCSSAWICY